MLVLFLNLYQFSVHMNEIPQTIVFCYFHPVVYIISGTSLAVNTATSTPTNSENNVAHCTQPSKLHLFY
jgi:hypothetical protein